MASWKVNGIVPDSDDDDSLDSESRASNGAADKRLALPRNDFLDCDRLPQVNTAEQRRRASSEKPTLQDCSVGDKTSPGSLDADDKESMKPCIDELRRFRRSSSVLEPIFELPRTLSDLGLDLNDSESESAQNHPSLPPRNSLPPTDEISKTYVPLTSPISSLLSSPPSSQHDEATENSLAGRRSSETPRPSSIDVNRVGVAGSLTAQLPTNFYRRSLRERAPIQLHPYVMEQEKYRQTLKARGIVPMRLAQAQDGNDRSIHVPSSDPNSRDLDSQYALERRNESQMMDYSRDLEPWSTDQHIASQISRTERCDSAASTDDDELPDINDLLHGRYSTSRRMVSKQRINTHSSKSKRPQLFRTQLQRTKSASHISNVSQSNHVLDAPASPPSTSFPITNGVGSTAKTSSQAMSTASEEPTPSWLDQYELNFLSATDSPTPVTNMIKPVADPTFLDSDLDDGPVATEMTNSVTSSTSSDESKQIQKVSKRIRGVLPASHLRLDQQLKKLKNSNRGPRESITASPEKSLLRRGVAVPRVPTATLPGTSLLNTVLPFISNDSDDDDSDRNGLFTVSDNAADLESLFDQSRMGLAQEEDRIDAMLPSLKRQGNFKPNLGKRRRLGSTSSPRAYQPKITQHLMKSQTSRKQSGRRAGENPPLRKNSSVQHRKPRPPRLSILDVTDTASRTDAKLPKFVRIAARTARTQTGQGRQSPSKKFIRLATREDTVDAQSLLEEWKGGRILPRSLSAAGTSSESTSRPPLRSIADNQARFPPPMLKAAAHFQTTNKGYGCLNVPRQLIISRERQTLFEDYTSAQQRLIPQTDANSDDGTKAVLRLLQRRTAKPHSGPPHSRPAQLESSTILNSYRNLTAAFKRTKKDLDTRFMLSRKHSDQQQNVQLHRFLAHEDAAQPSIETTPHDEPAVTDSSRSSLPDKKQRPKLRKQLPRRIDTGARRYRQPSEPLVLNILAPAKPKDLTGHGNKLMGLGKYGTRYPVHFEIFPLQPGIFFHESTFIGSGRLSEATRVPKAILLGAMRGHGSFRLGNKDFRWGQWSEDTASEVGLFFDCLVELLVQPLSSSYSADPTPSASMEFMIVYVQHTISFASSQSRLSFLTRMFEAVQDFSSRVSGAEQPNEAIRAQHWINTMARCTVLVLQLLQISRNVQAVNSLRLEGLLKDVAHFCTKLLVHQGLDRLRQLYDDLQYLSFRECGIKEDHYIALSWVVIMRVLDVARIPKGSFWDLASVALLEGDSKLVDDARTMEQIWYSVFSLLPLCEFDDFGVVIPGLRYKISFDNWTIPQQMLGRVLALYSSNLTQSPGFNDYCRALVSRCLYLMREWGWWKCSGMIGTVFDFFAAQKLEHLRNEEVYKSPRFLMELDTEPTLELEPEDRCFHVFLKIVALEIKHLRQLGDDRSIRNLVARLLPNHDRQYPKDEDIQTRDLAALRNHHDLLCTLYWVSPPDCRPSLSLIQELVDANYSHKEACLINLRALDNLARYIFKTTTDECTVYNQFTKWELTFFDKVLHQYLAAGSEVRSLAELLANFNGQPIPENEVQMNIDENRKSSMNTLQTLLSNLRYRITSAKDAEATLSALNAELLSKILNPGIFEVFQDIKEGMIGDAVDALHNYMDRTDLLHPSGSQQIVSSPPGIDSQGSLDFGSSDIERNMMIYPLHEVILPNFALITKGILECHLYKRTAPSFMERLVLCWARLVSFVTEEKYELREFILNGTNAVFENRQRHNRANMFWPLFLSQLLTSKSIDDLKVAGFDLGQEWMQIITSNPTLLRYEPDLSRRLRQQNHYLFQSETLPVPKEWPKRQLRLFQTAINSMRLVQIDPNYGDFAKYNRSSEKETQSLFSAVLKNTMDSMQRQLEFMIPQSTAHSAYVKFCQDAVTHLRGYASNIRPITDFFLQHSSRYWPKSGDPQLYAAGIVSYSFRLHSQCGKAPLELFHYLYNGWKNDQMRSRLKSHIACVLKGLKIWAFAEFMLSNFVPAIILTSFNTVGGCALANSYLPALGKSVQCLLQRGGIEGSHTFTYLINILKLIINCLNIPAAHQFPHIQPGHDDRETLGYRGIVSVAFYFWISIQPAMLEYVDIYPTRRPVLENVASLLNELISDIDFHLTIHSEGESSIGASLDVSRGEYVENFVVALQDDIEKHWVVTGTGTEGSVDELAMVKIVIGPRGGGVINVPLFQGVPTFKEVQELWKLSLGGTAHDRQMEKTEKGLSFPEWMIADHVETFPGVFRGLF